MYVGYGENTRLLHKYNYLYKDQLTQKEYDALTNMDKDKYYTTEKYKRYFHATTSNSKTIPSSSDIAYIIERSDKYKNVIFDAYRFCKEKNMKVQSVNLESIFIFILKHKREYNVSCVK